jgi:hypothetical protein
VDAQGRVHYSDVLPAQEGALAHQELDKQGRVVRETRPAQPLSPEAQRRSAEESGVRDDAQRREEEQKRRDRALLSTYADEGEIDLARDRALQLEQLTIKGLRARMDRSAARLAYANGQLARYREPGVAEPAHLVQMRDESQSELTQLGELLRQREQVVADLKERFEADKKRYQVLRGTPPR